ncbi:uncharacterized protein LOC127808177 [Diospyros lotus]|uniref:uncharacterized protein LOC127808177 n=1 Tax=Diospyros lotus TaxID=55363 RepID=UPI002256FE36|nr:uncharacterized protein LOC127808177 [Diospyros lotus]
MGCCVSTNSKPASPPKDHHHRHSSSARSADFRHSKAPPPLEEETVKEVLSETPNPKPPVPKIQDEKEAKIQEDDASDVGDKTPFTATEVSEVSDITSLSESVSTLTERREEDEGEVRQRVARSPSKLRRRGSTPAVGKSPVRRSDPSPGRVRLVPARERPGVAPAGQRQDSGDVNMRRLRSPAKRGAETGAARTAGLGRSPSDRKTGKSPDRVRSDQSEKTRKVRETADKEAATWPPPTGNESLENPLVSLECFIFL